MLLFINYLKYKFINEIYITPILKFLLGFYCNYLKKWPLAIKDMEYKTFYFLNNYMKSY